MTQEVWFEGSRPLECDTVQINDGLSDLGSFFSETVGYMPGISNVELVHQEGDKFVVKTNEGTMTRSSVVVEKSSERTLLQFNEVYDAGRSITVSAQHVHSFNWLDAGTAVTVTISKVSALGILGFFYKRFGKKSIGNAILASYQSYCSAKSWYQDLFR